MDQKCKMKFVELSDKILGELGAILHQVNDENVDRFVDGIISAERIFLTGMGRSGLITRPFAMRLMQLGLRVYIVGDATTPATRDGDLLIAISGSGETKMTQYIASKAKELGAKVFLLTIYEKSSIGDISDLIMILPDSTQPVLPLRSAFESASHIFLEAVVIMIMEKRNITQWEMMERHSNLE